MSDRFGYGEIGLEIPESEPADITNADTFRSMTVIGLANTLSGLVLCGCNNCPVYEACPGTEGCSKRWLDWLNSPAEVQNET